MSKRVDGRGYVIDTSALLALLRDEAGGDLVEALLDDPSGCTISMITLMEVRYLYLRQAGADVADEAMRLLGQLDMNEAPVTRTVLMGAARIKSQYHLSVADAIIAATALERGCTLVHRDPEFAPLGSELDLLDLPPK